MKRLIVTLHAGGIHVDVQNPAATENQQVVQYADRNFRPAGDFKTVAELAAFIQERQREVGAAQAVSSVATLREPEPPRAA